MAPLLWIRILCKAECKVVFTDTMRQVMYKGKFILTGYKDPKSNLWNLPIFQAAEPTTLVLVSDTRTSAHAILEHASFSYHQTNKENNVKFMHQSLCNPPISLLFKAINAGFLNGASQLTAKTVRKYLISSPATSKWHMKQPRKGLRSKTPKIKPTPATANIANDLFA